MSSIEQIDVAKLGAVLLEARRFRSNVLSATNELDLMWYRRLKSEHFEEGKQTTKNRVCQLPSVLRIAFGEALLGAASHFGFFDFWQMHAGGTPSDSKRAAIDYTHFFADTVPIQLYNFRMMLHSPEADLAMRRPGSIRETFENFFPHLIDARHAVAHQHDRNLSVRTQRGKRILFDTVINDECLTANGKAYRNEAGQSFTFDFELTRMRNFWDCYAKFMSEECV